VRVIDTFGDVCTGLPTKSEVVSISGPPCPEQTSHLLALACRAVRATEACLVVLSSEGELAEFLPVAPSAAQTRILRDPTRMRRLAEFIAYRPLPVRLQELPAEYRGESPCCLLGVPVVASGRRGALYFLRPSQEGPFLPDDEAVVSPLATWLLDEPLSREARVLGQLGMLNRVAQTAAGHLDLDTLFQVALQELDRHLPLYPCLIWLVDGGVGEMGAPEEADSPCRLAAVSPCLPDSVAGQLVCGMRLSRDQTPFTACLQEGQAKYTDLVNPDRTEAAGPTQLEVLLAGLGASCSFSVPLRAGERTLGILQSICLRRGGFTTEQIQLLYRVADLLGPALSNCLLFARLKKAYEDLNLAQHQLIQAEKMRALGEMASGVAHEFNNSLCGVLGFLELTLCNANLDPGCRTQLELARTCAQDAAHVVRRVQDFARQRRGEQEVEPVEVDALVRQTLEMIRHRWETQGPAGAIRVELVAEAGASVLGNPSELREVLTNLAFNAVDAMPGGGVLSLRTWAADGRVSFSVRDTGVGIPDSMRERIFEPFFTTKGEKGNGLGLSVAFAIVRRHHGEISVDSRPGRGTTFTVELPAAPRTANQPASPPEATPEPPAPAGLRILVVEDEAAVRHFLGLALQRMGHHARFAVDGREGVRILREETFDVIMTDLGLPGISGEGVIRAAAEHAPGTPVLLLTGWGEQLRQDQVTFPTAVQILDKPISLDTLAATLAEVTPSRTAKLTASDVGRDEGNHPPPVTGDSKGSRRCSREQSLADAG
jgi:signal transduction histidine kinase/CheY-like chemotaxis protein